MKKYQNYYLKIFIFGGKIFSVFEKACFHNEEGQLLVNGKKCAQTKPAQEKCE